VTYADKTEVTSEKSRAEIERTLQRYGADSFAYASEPTRAMVGFVMQGRQVRFVLPLPDRKERRFTHHSRGERTTTAAAAEYDQAVRQKWRALALMVKAKLEGVESGIVTFEQEFFAHTVLPNGKTVYEQTADDVGVAISTGNVRPLLQLGS
jgi:hypothetical protein